MLPRILIVISVLSLLFCHSHGQTCKHDGPLGLISGEIRDWQLTASSSFPAQWAKGCEERHARVYGPDGYAWCAQFMGASEWLQVDLGVAATVTGVMTQGRGNGKDWVTGYAVSYSLDAAAWSYVVDGSGKRKLFEANTDSYSVKHNYLDRPVEARLVRLHALQYHGRPSMRIELIGCQPCKQLISLPPYARLTASTSRGRRAMRNCDASYGHSMTGKSWCAKKQDRDQWLQVDLGPPTRVTGLVTKGRGDGKADAWVTAYRVAYGSDGKLWTLYKDADHLSPKVFGGNHDRGSERLHYLVRPFTARFVRFHPVAWHGRIAMRVGVYGCPHDGACDGDDEGEGDSKAAKGDGGDGAFFRVSNSSRCLANLAFGKAAWRGVTGGGSGDEAGGSGGRQHSKRQAAGAAGRIGWTEVGGGGCFAAVPGNAGWLVDLGSKQPVLGVLLTANDTSIGSGAGFRSALDRVDVFVAKRTRQLKLGGGRGAANFQQLQLRCGSADKLSDWTGTDPLVQSHRRTLHIACSKAMHGRFVYIEAHAAAATATAAVGMRSWTGRLDAAAAASSSMLCNLRVY